MKNAQLEQNYRGSKIVFYIYVFTDVLFIELKSFIPGDNKNS